MDIAVLTHVLTELTMQSWVFFIFFILHELKAHIITSPHVHVAFKPQTGKNCHFGFPTFDPLKFGLKGLFNEKTLTTTCFKLKVC